MKIPADDGGADVEGADQISSTKASAGIPASAASKLRQTRPSTPSASIAAALAANGVNRKTTGRPTK